MLHAVWRTTIIVHSEQMSRSYRRSRLYDLLICSRPVPSSLYQM